MRKFYIFLVAFIFINVNLFSAINFNRADNLYIEDEIDKLESLLQDELKNASSNQDKAEIYWRLSRNQVSLGDDAEKDSQKLEYYNLGLEYSNKSIDLYDNAMAHLWKSSNIGRIGQTKGVLKSLAAASDMRADLKIILDDFNELNSTETWYVLGALYTTVPGGFISFGNKTFGISYYRIAVDTIPEAQIYPNHYKALAEALYERNWSKSKRSKDIKSMNSKWKSLDNNYEKYAYYEGKDKGSTIPYYSSVALNKMSDRQEAVMLLNYAIAKYNAWPYHTDGESEAIEEIKTLKSQWT
ncbi:MAG: hypothetical protein ACPKM0_06270 [Pleomorphochaeta sp.]